MKNILLIATGGTIASSDQGKGLEPSLDAAKLLSFLSEKSGMASCNLTGISIMSIDSTNMNPSRMEIIAKSVINEYANYDGFVITHGTDTMGYTAAALSYMLQGINKAVILTGSQIAMEAVNTDAQKNISDAIHFACEQLAGVFIAFDGKLISGTHAVKCRTKSLDAFESINFPVIARVIEPKMVAMDIVKKFETKTVIEKNAIADKKIQYSEKLSVSKLFRKKEIGSEHFAPRLANEQSIFVLKIFPGLQPTIFDYIKEHCQGVILEGFGIGGIPDDTPNLVAKIHELTEAGIFVVITTQCIYEGIDLSVYAVGQTIAKQPIIYAGDMTTEALTMKLLWALANCPNPTAIRNFMETSICNDRTAEKECKRK